MIHIRALASFDLIIQGCTTFGTVDGKRFITSNRPQQIWVWKADSSVMLVRGPHFLGGDTLSSTSPLGQTEADWQNYMGANMAERVHRGVRNGAQCPRGGAQTGRHTSRVGGHEMNRKPNVRNWF